MTLAQVKEQARGQLYDLVPRTLDECIYFYHCRSTGTSSVFDNDADYNHYRSMVFIIQDYYTEDA